MVLTMGAVHDVCSFTPFDLELGSSRCRKPVKDRDRIPLSCRKEICLEESSPDLIVRGPVLVRVGKKITFFRLRAELNYASEAEKEERPTYPRLHFVADVC